MNASDQHFAAAGAALCVVTLRERARTERTCHSTQQCAGTECQSAGRQIRSQATQCAGYQPAQHARLVRIGRPLDCKFIAERARIDCCRLARQTVQSHQRAGRFTHARVESLRQCILRPHSSGVSRVLPGYLTGPTARLVREPRFRHVFGIGDQRGKLCRDDLGAFVASTRRSRSRHRAASRSKPARCDCGSTVRDRGEQCMFLQPAAGERIERQHCPSLRPMALLRTHPASGLSRRRSARCRHRAELVEQEQRRLVEPFDDAQLGRRHSRRTVDPRSRWPRTARRPPTSRAARSACWLHQNGAIGKSIPDLRRGTNRADCRSARVGATGARCRRSLACPRARARSPSLVCISTCDFGRLRDVRTIQHGADVLPQQGPRERRLACVRVRQQREVDRTDVAVMPRSQDGRARLSIVAAAAVAPSAQAPAGPTCTA